MPETSIDLSECDREQIHVPGSIQPHGVLVVTERSSLRILQAAGATDRMLGRSIDTMLDHTLEELLEHFPI
jgi:two-component system, chemotaxis family, sensor kinase Cph1